MTTITPMMRQYYEIKSQHEDAILFYRLGDFYEMFHDDAVEASRILDLTLTTRNKNSEQPIPLCGVPYHSAEGYISKLIAAGRKVVVCEQTEDPKQAKGIVKREVTRVVTPGIVMEDESLKARSNNFLIGFLTAERKVCCVVCDVSTGNLEYFYLDNYAELGDEISRLQAREVFYPESEAHNEHLKEFFKSYSNLYHHSVSDLFCDADFATDMLLTQYKVASVGNLGLKAKGAEVRILGLLLGYLKDNKLLTPDLLQQPVLRRDGSFAVIDEVSVRNLELFRTLRDDNQQGTLLWHLDSCATPMGSRRLSEFIRSPLMSVDEITQRQDAVADLLTNESQCDDLTIQLQSIADLERLANRFLIKSATPRDAVKLRDSFEALPHLQNTLAQCSSPLMKTLREQIVDFSGISQTIATTLVDEPPLSIKDGGFIRHGVSAELDELREIESSGKGTIAKLEAEEKQKTGISSLKIRYNNVFGYYIEITNTHKDKVPQHYVRKQTLTNAERYITDELKKYESKVLGAGERIKSLELDLFVALRDEVAMQAAAIKSTAQALATLDAVMAFATISKRFNYVRPRVVKQSILNLKGARHPILERLNQGDSFVPNDITLDQRDNIVQIITGPNMAGKSTIMRMTALIVILAQAGCFVPCEQATVGLCDRIFTRVGAHDHLQKGLSTFMVEMVETAKILREATSQSLVLLDEIGRGTSTFDGLSIAWAVAEDLHDRVRARTLFATHYHELCDLAEQKEGVKNCHMSVKEWNGQIIFLRKLKSGGTNRSYGVAVAQMAGLPDETIKRAREVLKLLELKDLSFQSELELNRSGQMSLFQEAEPEVVKRLKEIDVNTLTPVMALQVLDELKQMV